MALDENLRKKLEESSLSREDVLSLLDWQLSLPAEEMDCSLISECDLFLAGEFDEIAALSDEKQDALYARLLDRIGHEPALRMRGTHKSAHRTRPRRMTVIVLLALLLLALTVGGVAYSVRRGVLNFTEDFGFARMVSQEGAEEFVNTALAHVELDHVVVDVLEAVYDGAELRIVYSLTDKSGELHLSEHMANGYIMPGSEEGDVHMCDFVCVNGQDAYFYDTWEMPGDVPGQMLYYLQTNLPSWGVDVSGADTLTIGLPMLPAQEGQRGPGTVDFTIPAAVPEGLVRSATILESEVGGHRVSVKKAVFSPLNGYIEIRIEGLTREFYHTRMTGWCEIYAMDGSLLTSSHPDGPVGSSDDGGMTLAFTITPTEGDWPEQMILALEFEDYSPDWEFTICLDPKTTQ